MTAGIPDANALLLSNQPLTVIWDPFCFFYVDDYLPSDLYRSLLASFPEDEDYSYDRGGKLGFRSSVDADAVERFCATHPDWQALVDFFSSDAFAEDTRRTFERALIAARGLAGRRRWIHCTRREPPRNWLRYHLQEPMRTTFQFSLLPRDANVVPHADAPRKLVSLLLYFSDPDWEEAWGGETEFYVPLDAARAQRWSPTQRIPFEEFKPIGTTGFTGNRLAGFVRSANSYHGVPALRCPAGRTRKALLVNLKKLTWNKRFVP